MVYGRAIAIPKRPFIKIVDVDYHQKDEFALQLCRFWGVLKEIRTRGPVAKAGGRASVLLLAKSSGFSILSSAADFPSANPKTDPLCPRHRNSASARVHNWL
jgi:hypothetical protein